MQILFKQDKVMWTTFFLYWIYILQQKLKEVMGVNKQSVDSSGPSYSEASCVGPKFTSGNRDKFLCLQ